MNHSTTHWMVLDISSTALEQAGDFIESPAAPANYKDPEKIAAYIAEKKAEELEKCGLDLDLGRITAVGFKSYDMDCIDVRLCKTEDDERQVLKDLRHWLLKDRMKLIGFNSLSFDWPFLLRRARYLGVSLNINCDRYRTQHIDLLDQMTNHGQLRKRSLSFYVKRHGWSLTKPLSGAEESQVPQTGKWDELQQSVEHDVEATYRLACWWGAIDVNAVIDDEQDVA